MVTFMSKPALRTPVPALVGRRIVSAYIFSDESAAHGVVLNLDDGSDLSVEFNHAGRVTAEVVILKAEDDVAVVLQLVD